MHDVPAGGGGNIFHFGNETGGVAMGVLHLVDGAKSEASNGLGMGGTMRAGGEEGRKSPGADISSMNQGRGKSGGTRGKPTGGEWGTRERRGSTLWGKTQPQKKKRIKRTRTKRE